MPVNIWKKSDRQIHVREEDEFVVGHIGPPEDVRNLTRKNGWKNTGPADAPVKVSKASEPDSDRYNEFVKQGYDHETASRLSGYNHGA